MGEPCCWWSTVLKTVYLNKYYSFLIIKFKLNIKKVTFTFHNYSCLHRLLRIWYPSVAWDFRSHMTATFTSHFLVSLDLYNILLNSLFPNLTFKIKLKFRCNNTEPQIWMCTQVQLSAFLLHTLRIFTLKQRILESRYGFRLHGSYLLTKYTVISYVILSSWSLFLCRHKQEGCRSWSAGSQG